MTRGKPITIWSEGTRLAGDLFVPDGGRRPGPAIVCCHGWGGLKEHLNATYAPYFARRGFAVLTFDYRGWGESDGKLVRLGDGPNPGAGETTIRALAVREVVDPLDQLLDIRSALDFLAGESVVDPDRIGVWGSSYGGGHVVVTAATDSRVRCVVAQVGGFGPPEGKAFVRLARGRATQKARGELRPPVPQGIDVVPGLRGTPDVAKMFYHRPRDHAARVQVPTLIIDADHDELTDPREHGRAVYETIRQHAPARYESFPCRHYAIYDEYFDAGAGLAADWFTEHLQDR